MGCGNTKEKLENEMIAMKLERVGIQMERRNQIKLLEDIEGRKIKQTYIPDYLALSPEEKNEQKIKTKEKFVNTTYEKRKRSQSVNVNKKIRNIKTNSTTAMDKKSSKSKKSIKRIIK